MTQPAASDEVARWRLAAAADVRLQAQLAAGVAADQRALVFAGLLGAGVIALGGAAASLVTSTDSSGGFFARVALATGIEFIVAMACAVIAARPVSFHMAGATPANWKDDLANKKPVMDQLTELLADYDDQIGQNDATLAVNGRWLMAAAIIALFGLAVSAGVISWHVLR